MTEPEISIIIVNWNTRDLLRGCLRSIASETTASHEVIVTDNASGDGSSAMLAAEFPTVRLIANASNRGFAAANNQGLRVASGRFLLLLNPDTVILDRAIDRCLALLRDSPDIGCLGCQVWETPDRIQRTCFRFPTLISEFAEGLHLERRFPQSRILSGPWMPEWDRRSSRDVEVVSGMFLLVRREVMAQIGLLDESYFVYGEEADWCYQMARHGVRRHFTTAARILHLEGGGKSTSQRSVAMYVQQLRSLVIFFRKNYGFTQATLLRGMLAVRMLLRLLASLVMMALGRPAGPRVCAQTLGALRLLLAEPARLLPIEGTIP